MRHAPPCGGCAGPGKRISAPALDEFLIEEILDKMLTCDCVTAIVKEIEMATGEWWKDRERRRMAIVAEIRTA